MEDGEYESRIVVAGQFARDGWLTSIDNVVRGGDSVYAFHGLLKGSAANTVGRLTVDLAPGIARSRHIDARFSLSVSGWSDTDTVSLIGVGPRGLIIEFKGWGRRVSSPSPP